MAARDALLICNSQYIDVRLRALASPLNDGQELSSVLGDPELGAFTVTSLIDQEIQEIRIAIARFCQNRERDDVALIYYSGDGLKDDSGRLYLALKDTQTDLLSATGLSGPYLLEELSRSRARSKVLIVDCSYAGAILRYVTVPSDIAILVSSSGMEYSFEEFDHEGQSRPKSQFTAALIEGLRTGDADLDGDGTVTFNELFLYASRVVELAGGRRQRPRMFDLTEKPIVAGRAARPVFISYSRSDMAFAASLSDELRAGGHKVWIDTKGIAGGEDWRERIGAAIDGSKLVLAVLSTEALNSSWVRRELSYADKVGKPILPVVYRTCELPSWYELQFGHIQRLDLTGQADALETGPLLSSVKQALQSR